MAMAAAVAALAAAPGERSVLTGFRAVETSYPGFADDLRRADRGGPAEPRALLVAIDGPAGAGKSTVSAAVAARLGLDRLDTGAMYRAVAALALARASHPTTQPAVAALAEAADIEVGRRVVIDGHDVTDVIRTPEVGPGRVAGGGQPRRARASWCSASGPGPRPTAGGWSRAATSARSSSPRPS